MIQYKEDARDGSFLLGLFPQVNRLFLNQSPTKCCAVQSLEHPIPTVSLIVAGTLEHPPNRSYHVLSQRIASSVQGQQPKSRQQQAHRERRFAVCEFFSSLSRCFVLLLRHSSFSLQRVIPVNRQWLCFCPLVKSPASTIGYFDCSFFTSTECHPGT